MAQNSMTSTALFQSGVLVRNPLMEAQLGSGGDILNIPAWGDLLSRADPNGSDPNVSSDDPTSLSTPNKISAVSQLCRKSYLNQSWAATNFAGELAGSDPMQRITERLLEYWDRTYEYRLVQSLIGVLLSNVANNNSDMVVDISAAATDAPVSIDGVSYTDPGFTRDAVISAAGTIGDRSSDFRAIAMHSATFRKAQRNNEIEFVRDSDNNIMFASYAGLACVVDDSLAMPTAGVYLSVLFGAGAVGFADGNPTTGFGIEVFRTPDAGKGGGMSTLYTRRNSIIHPLGFSFNSASVAGSHHPPPTLPKQPTGPARPSAVRASRCASFAACTAGSILEPSRTIGAFETEGERRYRPRAGSCSRGRRTSCLHLQSWRVRHTGR
jgi:hypothetical protein